jgi:hypothetical protein
MACAPAFAGGGCVNQDYLFCGATSSTGGCCPPAQPYYCSTSNLCYATAQQAAAACPQAGCVACASQATGTCSVAPTGGSCIGYPGYLFCGGICCPANLPYYCSTANLCYPTAGQAAAACPAADCLQCASTCAAPPATLPPGGGDGICGNEQPLAVIDGIAAYAMCDAALTGNVWSDNGTATAAMSDGAGWVETETGVVGSSGNGGYQCTELATRYFYFKFGVCPWISSAAKDMCNGPFPAGVAITATPVHGDLAVFPPGCDGADATTGHGAVVDQVTATAVSVVQEHSGTAGTGTYARSCLSCFLHATANSGTP